MIARCTLPTRRRGLTVAVVGALLSLGTVACGSNDSAGDDSTGGGQGAVTIQSATGAITLPGPAQRVAVMQWQFLEDLLALGVQPAAIADEQQPGSGNPMPQQFDGKLGKYTSLGSRISPNLEVLASLPVDLIVADKSEHLKDYDQFSAIAPTLILDTSSWSDFYSNLEKLGQAVGKADKAAQVEASVKEAFTAAKGKLSAASAKRALVGVPTPDKFFAFTGNSLQAGVLTELGLTYSYKEVAGKLSEQIPLDALAQSNADVVFLTVDPGNPVVTDTWKGNTLWESIPAVRDGKVFTVDRSIWSVGRGAMSVPAMIDQTVAKLAKA